MNEYPFRNLAGGDGCTLLVTPGEPPGVRHPDCTALAGVAVELDAFYCTACGYNGRVSGGWVHDLNRQGKYELRELLLLLNDAVRSRRHHVLHCGPEVARLLAAEIPEKPTLAFGEPNLGVLLNVPVVVEHDMEPRAFRMVRHDRCHVDADAREVRHGNCPVTEGTVL